MLRNLQRVLRCFEPVFGLKINIHKSSLVGLKKDDSFMANTSSLLSCKVESLPIKYLGLLLGIRKPSIREWSLVIDWICERLALLKGPLLSSTGRLVLLKSTLTFLYISCHVLNASSGTKDN